MKYSEDFSIKRHPRHQWSSFITPLEKTDFTVELTDTLRESLKNAIIRTLDGRDPELDHSTQFMVTNLARSHCEMLEHAQQARSLGQDWKYDQIVKILRDNMGIVFASTGGVLIQNGTTVGEETVKRTE